MSVYLLDTCTISDFFSGISSTKKRLLDLSPSQIAISAITVMEISYGFRLKPAIARKFSTSFNSLCRVARILPFDQAAAQVAADIRSELKKKGTPIGSFDLLIAAIAMSQECILATSNVSEFARIKDLQIQNWRLN
jgi:tRNA(fMet)-specific endonuclease VapC